MVPRTKRTSPRVARFLESAAGLVQDGVMGYATDPAETPGLSGALRHDAEIVRTLADEN